MRRLSETSLHASGDVSYQRWTAPSDSQTCEGAYVVVASDPRISSGTHRCTQVSTRSDRGLLYTHGHLDVEPSSKPRKPILDVMDIDLGNTSGFDI
jgi:hypothetical protein